MHARAVQFVDEFAEPSRSGRVPELDCHLQAFEFARRPIRPPQGSGGIQEGSDRVAHRAARGEHPRPREHPIRGVQGEFGSAPGGAAVSAAAAPA